MKFLGQKTWPDTIDQYYLDGQPFFFFISYDKERALVLKEEELTSSRLSFHFNPEYHPSAQDKYPSVVKEKNQFEVEKVPEELYKKAFDHVMDEIQLGNTYLINLCFRSKITNSLNLREIYNNAQAPYKLLFDDQFVVFSPESFVRIGDEYAYAFPMKGTIDAKVENAASRLKNDAKELAEHYTIVDLLRNDLGQISEVVEVEEFAFLTEFNTHRGPILQMSSKIKGHIDDAHKGRPGKLLNRILPAGSITGAPKERTIQIIKRVETFQRNFYTGIMGHFNGTEILTAVMIRFIEKDKKGNHWYKSGGGITHMSEWEKEFDELNRKIYLPFL